ncbi:DUF397 domain-containing protein [Actinophytocola sp.]|uniref:DUF397 domain-containing protein n=1 Tax=Actinophytocola sp. TaxID=1872138 RepID=UPI003D6B2933
MIIDTPAFWREAEFRKSSFSGGNGGDCVEMAWRKSSFSGSNGGNCVELARSETVFGIRDSKNTDGPVLTLSEALGRAFLATVKRSR